MKKLVNEEPKHRKANQEIEDRARTHPATLSDQRPGVAVFLGRFKVCLSRDGAYRLAESIINSLEESKTS